MTPEWRGLRTSIELRHLRYLIAASEHGSFRKAAIALAIRESSISRGIRDLEDRLGVSLFERHLAGSSLNPAGERFLHEARIAIKHLHQGALMAGLGGRRQSEHLGVGIISSLASNFLSESLRSYNERYPNVRIDFSDGYLTEHITAVRLHKLDIAFVSGTVQHTGCESTHLWSEQVFAVLPAAHLLADRQSLTWPDLIGETFIVSEQAPGRELHDILVQRHSDLGQHPEVQRQNVGRDNLMSLVAIGCGLTLTSEATTAIQVLGLVYRPIAGETLPFSAVWSPKNDKPALRRLLSMARARREAIKPIGLSTIPPYPPSNGELS